jgi:hypothetical protein
VAQNSGETLKYGRRNELGHINAYATELMLCGPPHKISDTTKRQINLAKTLKSFHRGK